MFDMRKFFYFHTFFHTYIGLGKDQIIHELEYTFRFFLFTIYFKITQLKNVCLNSEMHL